MRKWAKKAQYSPFYSLTLYRLWSLIQELYASRTGDRCDSLCLPHSFLVGQYNSFVQENTNIIFLQLLMHRTHCPVVEISFRQ